MMKQETDALTAELEKTFATLRECCGTPEALSYFLDLARAYFDPARAGKRPEVLIMGGSVPEELLWANGLFPHWVIGGSLAVSDLIDSLVPRDANAISRSMLGYLERYLPEDDSRTPILVPIIGDNERKLAYLLREEGRSVYSIDITPEISPEKRYHSVASQLSDILSELTLTWNLPGVRKRMYRAAQDVSHARAALRTALAAPGLRTCGILRMFLLNTYFYAETLSEWAEALERLTAELPGDMDADAPEKPGVLIVGSPVLFPNYKVPVLLEQAGLSVLGTCDCLSGKLLSITAAPESGSRGSQLYSLVRQTYGNDCSGVYVSNDALYEQASHLIERLPVRGVIFHVIKGQIEYDFELERLEQLFSEHKLPVFRLETDYHDNDMEQIRIRLEAFAELLT